MRKLIITLTMAVFLTVMVNTSFAKEEKIVTLGLMSIPLLVGSTAVGVCIGAPEIALPLLTVYGAYKTHKGDWGKDSLNAVKECPGTHVNDNCAHLSLSKLGTGTSTANGGNFK